MSTSTPDTPTTIRSSLDDLLQPSLIEPRQALFSLRASFLVAFFGGVFAFALFGAVNARRMGRLRTDVWLHAGFALAWAVLAVWFGMQLQVGNLPEVFQTAGNPGRSMRYLGRLLALALLGSTYLLQRQHFRSQQLVGKAPADPWPWGLGASGLAIGLSALLVLLGKELAS